MNTHTQGRWGKATGSRGLAICAREDGKPVTVADSIRGEANQRVIAAAPKLLALLIESQESIGGDWHQRRDAAIKEATGT